MIQPRLLKNDDMTYIITMAHLAEFEFPAKHDLAISHVRGLPMAQGWASRLVGSLKVIPASKSAATRCPLGSYGLSKLEQKVRVI